MASKFLSGHPCVAPILAGTPYNMNDPGWLLVNGYQNRSVCAYTFFSAFHMLGYNTEMGPVGVTDPQLRVLHAFQTQHGLPVGSFMTLGVLLRLDALLALREAKIAATASTFPLYDHMQPLLPNEVSKDWLAYIYQLPMNALPPYLQMAAYETAQCIWGQCLGSLQDPNGANLPCQQLGCYTTDLNSVDYRFAGAYFDPNQSNSVLPSAARDVGTVLHEYAHYLDGTFSGTYPALPHLRIINTFGFYNISYDMSQYQSTCAPRRTIDPKDWITKYAFVGSGPCPAGKAQLVEEFAEAFSIYVTAGKHFRAAAQQNPTSPIAQKYNWLKTNVFQGIEYDTDLQRGVESGCNDVPGYQQSQPGYTSCSEGYIWDGELRQK